MKIISLVCQKGGVGKTTTALSLASYWHLQGKKVAIIDADPQQSAVYFAERMNSNPNSTLKGMDIYSIERPSELNDIYALDADIVIIDTAGRDDLITVEAIKHSEAVIVPIRPSAPDIKASAKTYQKIVAEGKSCAYLITQVINASTLHEEAYEAFEKNDLPYLKNHISMTVYYSRTFPKGETPYSHNNYCMGGIQIKKLADEIEREILK